MKTIRALLAIALAALFVSCASSKQEPVPATEGGTTNTAEQPGAEPQRSRYEGTIAAPAFPQGLDWINVSRPVTWEDLRGKIVIIDFWTYGCINCIHMIPVLEQLQETYSQELVVLGVHSAKFDNEGSTENIRQVAQRYGRTEAIVNDYRFQVWSSWGVQAWPTIAVVDPRGNVLGIQGGELPYDALSQFVKNVEFRFDQLGLMNREPLAILQPDVSETESLLLFPGKVLADEAGNRIFISDSNHNRIVVAELTTGRVLDVIGSGDPDLADGSYDLAAFHKPQGLALQDDTLYVADLDNQAIREVDLTDRSVRTIAGSGVRGSGYPPPGVVTDPLSFDLRSPWDLEVSGSDLYIAMAGTHQIWKFDIGRQTLEVAVGDGREALVNGTLASSELAQPSGLHYSDGELYFADSESSTIRVADFPNNRVATLAGPVQNSLFDFGDQDGMVGDSRLQHPLGVTGAGDTIYVADTYNSRIKAIDLGSKVTTTIFGLGGSGGYRDGTRETAQFDEPGGIDYAGGKLYVADTNNHAIRVIDLTTGLVDTLVLRNVAALTKPDSVTLVADTTPAGLTFTLPDQTVRSGPATINVEIELPEGYKLNPLVQSNYLVMPGDPEAANISPDVVEGTVDRLEFSIPAQFTADTTIAVRFSLYYCETEQEQVCILDDSEVIVPVKVSRDGGAAVVVRRVVELPELPGFSE